jgi:hypothetical protein
MATKDKNPERGELVMSLKGDITLRLPAGQSNLPVGAPATVEAVEQAIKAELGRSGAIVHVTLTRTDK